MTSPFERPGPARLPPLPRSLRRIVVGIVAALFVALIVVPWLASFATDWLWFKEIGFQSVFATSLIWRIGLFLIGGVFAFGYIYGNVRLARGTGTGFPVLYVNRGDGVSVDVSRMLTRLFLPAALVLAFLTAVSASASWLVVLKGFNGVPIGTRDPSIRARHLFLLVQASADLGRPRHADHADVSLDSRRGGDVLDEE